MITSVIGRTFLKAYNEKYGKGYSPKEFFEKEYRQTFFNHEKYLMSGGNSPFENPKISWEKMIKGIIPFESQEKRDERFMKFMEKAQSVKGNLDASIAMGFPASDEREYASTSGLVSDLIIPVDEDEVYLSWIGSGLGITVAGGFSILFDNPIITLQTFEGWRNYRKYLNDPTLDKLRGNQINTWNGQWLTYSMDPDKFREDFDFTELQGNGIFKVDTSLAEVNTVNWSQLFFSLSQVFPKEELMGYVYGFGQTNKTIGFIPFQFKSGTRIKDVYSQLFGGKYSTSKEFESLFGMHIKRACELGSIGLLALRPDSLVKYMQDGKNLNFKKEEDLINYQAYKTWLIAMLSKNKEQITDYTMEIAKVILSYRNGGKGNSRITLVDKNLFDTKSKKEFLEHLTTIVSDADESNLEEIKQLRNEIHLMTNEEFIYFITLLKFDYSYLQRKTN
ncbi:hypothetical protein SAMN00777080_3053 [Aquiflexum balticum DSM 16537]|uniref:Uncharacterized protein n=1 Tax=Aquiflexum balticum DSM 16537 TaxID=758820 RepID=A0A1W2H721_9BACT|nr:hypothetical protein [Aquiflexum balticum]SMD44432.1 hypothetical protein SAMN00777080_3053 [Aquiflexum balticum DSM 16537]